MKCHNCKKRMPRSELKKHTCVHRTSNGLRPNVRLYMKRFGSRPSKKVSIT